MDVNEHKGAVMVMLKHPIAKIDMCDDKISFTKEINVLDAIHCIKHFLK
jgi:hypothetical protein